jgi:hypothetical protein
MKYIKTYELYAEKGTGNVIDYEEGDIVTCVKAGRFPLNLNDKFEVLKIYTIMEDKYLGNKFLRVDVKNIETGEKSFGWESTRFKSEMEDMADKYNL